MALSVISLLRSDSVAFGCEADMRTVDRSNQSDVNDPTETWAAQDFRSAKALFVPSLKRDIVPLLHAHNLRPEGSHGNPHPTARIRIRTGRHSSRVAACGGRAAGRAGAAHWCAHVCGRGRYGKTSPPRGIRAGPE